MGLYYLSHNNDFVVNDRGERITYPTIETAFNAVRNAQSSLGDRWTVYSTDMVVCAYVIIREEVESPFIAVLRTER